MNTQLREDMDYQMGSASELQNAHTLGRMSIHEKNAKVNEQINELVNLGRVVLVGEVTAYCPHTDAPAGVHRHIVGDYATFAEADLARGEENEKNDGEVYFKIEYKKATPPPVDLNRDDVPF